jgi:GH15 family glucan-1,4-alpha-glucosidase
MASRIEDYGLIGNCETAALVGRDGSIDWLCWPRFDSDACFAALIGRSEHGRWQIAPRDKAKVTRRYRGHSLILETRFETATGAALLVDFMPLGGGHSSVVRLVIGESGQVAMSTELVLRFGYGAIVPWVTRLDDGTLRAVAGPDMALLRTPVKLVGHNMKTVGEFTVHAGGTIAFAGCAMRRSLCSPSWRRATTRRHSPGANGCCGPWPEVRTRFRSCTELRGSGG